MAKRKVPAGDVQHRMGNDGIPAVALHVEPSPKRRPEMGERFPLIIRGVGQRAGTLYNPDDLVGRKGLEVYDRMGTDDQVAAALKVKRLSRLASGWDVVSASEDRRDLEIRDFVVETVGRLPGSLDAKLLQMMSCLQYGFSVAEKIWDIGREGTRKGKIVLRDLKPKAPFGIYFKVDEYGNVQDDGIELQGAGVQNVRRDKCVVWSYGQEFTNPYGRSDLRPAYRSWFSKDFIMKYFNLHIERFASPTIVAHIPDNFTEPEVLKIQTVLETIQSQTAITLPKDVDVKWQESRLGGAIAFRFGDAIDMHNKFISRAILVPDLMGYSGSVAGGSFALGKKQVDVFFMILRALGTEIEETVMGEQIIRPLVDLNFPNVVRYPRFRFREIESDLATKVKILQLMVQTGAVDPREDWVRGWLDLPEQALPPHRQEIFSAQTVLFERHGFRMGSGLCRGCRQLVQHEFVADLDEQAVYHPDCWRGRGNEAVEVVIRDGAAHTFPMGAQAAAYQEIQQAQDAADDCCTVEQFDDAARPLTRYERATPFREMRDVTDAVIEDAGRQARRIFTDMRDRLLTTVRKRQIVVRRDYEALERLTVNVGEFSRLLLGTELTMAGNGQVWAARELARKLPQQEMADRAVEIARRAQAPAEAKGFFNGQRLRAGGATIRIDLGGVLNEFFSSRSYGLAGIEKDWIVAQARAILGNAIKQGDPRVAEEQLAALFDQYVARGDTREGKPVRPVRLFNILQTTASEALNEGRRAVFEGEGVRDRVVAYQWSSVLDANTTEYCRRMDQQVFRKEQIATLVPPAHYRCRSTLVAVVEGEEFEFSRADPTSPATGVVRQQGFCEP